MIKVYSKINLDKDLQNKVLEALQKKYSEKNLKSEDLQFLIDKSIISGVKIDIDSEIIDLTLNNRLEKIFDVLNK